MELKAFVKACRLKAGKNQREWAEALGLKSTQTVTNYESGTGRPSFLILGKMLELSNLKLEQCLTIPEGDSAASREQEDAEARAMLEALLNSQYRDGVVRLLRSYVPLGVTPPSDKGRRRK